MLVSEVIADLQKVLDEHGDIPAIYSVDAEGNDHQGVESSGTIMYVEDINEYFLDMLDTDEVNNGLYENTDYSKVVCIN